MTFWDWLRKSCAHRPCPADRSSWQRIQKLAPDGQTRGMKAAVYRKLWPKIVTQPSEYAGRFDQVLLVDTTIEAAAFIEHGNVVQGINPDSCHDLVDQPKDEQGNPLHLKRYVAFIQLGEKNLGRSVMGCRDSFAQDELGLTTREGLHLPIEHADYLRQYAVDLAGSGYGEVCAPCVYWFGSVQPELYRSHVGHRYSSYGSASRGSKVFPAS